MLMETEKSNNLLSSSWRPRKANHIIQSETQESQWCRFQFELEGLRNQEYQEQEKLECPSWSNQAGKRVIPPSCTFSSIQAFNELDDAHPRWEGQSIESTD